MFTVGMVKEKNENVDKLHVMEVVWWCWFIVYNLMLDVGEENEDER